MPFDGMPDGYAVAVRAIARGMLPPRPLSIWQWADENVVLPRGTSPRHGRYRTAITPMAREIQEVLSPHHPAKKVVAMMSSQLLKTQVGLNFIMYHQAHDPQTELVVYPTIDLAEDWSNDKYSPIAAETAAIRDVLSVPKSRDGGNTILKKQFLGGSMKVAGANSPASLASRGGAILWCDEVDRYPASAGIEGDPVSIAERALIAYQETAKEYLSSTPTIESLSRINKEFQLSDQRHYHVPCPGCGHLHVLEWDHFKWDKGHPETAHFVCPENGCIIREHDKATMLPDEHMGGRAKWIAANPGSKIPGFHAWAAYAPLGMGLSWHTLAEKWEECAGDPEKEKVYINIYRGQCFKDPTEKLDADVIKDRAERYNLRTIPAGCLILTAGVDVQGNRLSVQMLGWGRSKVWVIDHVELPGDPTKPEVWAALDKLLDTPIANRFGMSLKPRVTIIDSGYLTDEVLKFCRARSHRGIFAGHGTKQQGQQAISTASPQDRSKRGKPLRGGVKSWRIGTDTVKSELVLWLQRDGEVQLEAERRVHFSDQLAEEYFSQLCAEIWDPHKRKWVKQQARNEALDTFVYCIAASRHPTLRLHLMRDADWKRYEDAYEPQTGDLFAAPQTEGDAPPATPEAQQQATPQPPPTRPRIVPRKTGFVNAWKK